MTMGIVLVACLAARIAARSSRDKDIDLELHEFGHEAWDTVQFSLSVAILNQDVFPLDITEISQPLPECLSKHYRLERCHDKYPTRGIFADCCAWARSQPATTTATTRKVEKSCFDRYSPPKC